MRLRNPFKPETRELFRDVQYHCMDCGGNGQDCGGVELHHICSRVSASPYNASVLCKKCHAKVGHTKEEETRFIKITKRYLDFIGFIPNDRDKEFLSKHI